MNIIVCIKQVPISNRTKFDNNTHTMIRDENTSVINPYDMYAIEESIRLKEKHSGNVSVISMGIPSVSDLLKEAMSLGADKGILLSDKRFAGSDTLATAYVLSLCIKKISKFDIILCGKQAIDGDTGQVGPALAEKLNINHVTNVKEIECVEGERIICHRLTEYGYERIQTRLPVLLTVVKEINVPRLPDIKSVLQAEESDVTVWNAEDINADTARLGLKGSPTRVIKAFTPVHNVKCDFITGSTEEQIDKLLKKINIKQIYD